MLVEPATAVAVPPQVFESPLGVATTSPVGRVSVKATPVSATVLAAGLVMVKVREVVPFSGMVAAPNALAIDGGATTMTLAEGVPPVPPSVEVTLPVVLFCWPAVVPVTFTAKVQEVLCARLPPVRLMTFVAWVAVIVPPPQLPVSPFGVEITRPAGRVSLKPTPVSVVVVLLFWMVKVREVEPFSGMLAAPKALMMTGGATTVMLAFEVFPAPAFVEVAWTLLFLTPAVVPVTSRDIVHEAPGARLAPDRLTEEDPSTAVAVPLHVLFRLPGVATIRPDVRVSVNATPFSVRFALVLVSVKVRLVVPLSGIEAAPKALAMVGGLITVMLALAVLPVSPPASVAVTLPLMLFCTPSVTPLTSTATVQVVLMPTVPPLSLIEPVPPPAVTVPAHALPTLGVLATASPEGRLSVKARPFSEFAVLILVMVKVRVVVPFTGIWAAPNALAMDGGNRTGTTAMAAKPSTTAWTLSIPPLVPVYVAVALPVGTPAVPPPESVRPPTGLL